MKNMKLIAGTLLIAMTFLGVFIFLNCYIWTYNVDWLIASITSALLSAFFMAARYNDLI